MEPDHLDSHLHQASGLPLVFFLLETFWMDTDWDELCTHWEIRSSLLRVQTIMEYLGSLKYTFMAEAIIPRPFGIQLAGILAGERDIDIWNLPRQWKTEEHDIEIDEPFFRPFVPLFPGGALEKTLSREKIFMDGNPRSRKRFVSPWEDDGPSVDQVRIGELNLFIGQEILYLFDYGDEWHFRVTVEDIRTDETQDKKPAVTAEKGAAPGQYGLSAP